MSLKLSGASEEIKKVLIDGLNDLPRVVQVSYESSRREFTAPVNNLLKKKIRELIDSLKDKKIDNPDVFLSSLRNEFASLVNSILKGKNISEALIANLQNGIANQIVAVEAKIKSLSDEMGQIDGFVEIKQLEQIALIQIVKLNWTELIGKVLNLEDKPVSGHDIALVREGFERIVFEGLIPLLVDELNFKKENDIYDSSDVIGNIYVIVETSLLEFIEELVVLFELDQNAVPQFIESLSSLLSNEINLYLSKNQVDKGDLNTIDFTDLNRILLEKINAGLMGKKYITSKETSPMDLPYSDKEASFLQKEFEEIKSKNNLKNETDLADFLNTEDGIIWLNVLVLNLNDKFNGGLDVRRDNLVKAKLCTLFPALTDAEKNIKNEELKFLIRANLIDGIAEIIEKDEYLNLLINTTSQTCEAKDFTVFVNKVMAMFRNGIMSAFMVEDGKVLVDWVALSSINKLIWDYIIKSTYILMDPRDLAEDMMPKLETLIKQIVENVGKGIQNNLNELSYVSNSRLLFNVSRFMLGDRVVYARGSREQKLDNLYKFGEENIFSKDELDILKSLISKPKYASLLLGDMNLSFNELDIILKRSLSEFATILNLRVHGGREIRLPEHIWKFAKS